MNSNENAGPPDALLAVPTNYHNYGTDGSSGDPEGLDSAASDELLPLDEGCARDVVIDDPEEETTTPDIVAEGLDSAPSEEFLPLDEGCARDVVIDDEEETASPDVVAEDPKGKNLEPDSLGLPAPPERIGGSYRGEEGNDRK